MRIGGILLAATLAAAPAVAFGEDDKGATKAESWDDLSAGAIRLDRSDLAGLIWTVVAACDDGDQVARRQCRAVRAARARRLEGKALIVPGDAAAFTVGAFDAKKQTAPLTVSGCVACVEPMVVDGASYYVTSKAETPTFEGSVARAGTVHTTHKKFDDEAAVTAFRADVVPRLRTELVVQLSLDDTPWKRDQRAGIGLTVLGFRVFDPCDGKVVCASPRAERAEIDKAACGEAVVEGGAEAEPSKPKHRKPTEIPEELTPSMIKDAMRPARAAAQACFDTYGVAGDTKLHVTVNGSGAVTAVDVTGDFAGTPTGECITKAVQAIAFPKTKKSKQSFKYPIVLR